MRSFFFPSRNSRFIFASEHGLHIVDPRFIVPGQLGQFALIRRHNPFEWPAAQSSICLPSTLLFFLVGGPRWIFLHTEHRYGLEFPYRLATAFAVEKLR